MEAINLVQNEMESSTDYPETADIETSSEDYARRFSGKVGEWFLETQEKATLQMLAPHPGATILDVGGGHGQLTGALIRNGFNVTVLGSADVCKKRITHFVDNDLCEFKVGNILELPFVEQAYDVVISYRLLPHVKQWQRLLAELCRVAGKAVIVDYPEVRSVNYIAPYLFRFKKQLEGNTRPFTCFKGAELLAHFKSHGMELGERYPEFFVPMVIHRMLKLPPVSTFAEWFFRRIGLTTILGSPVILKVTRSR